MKISFFERNISNVKPTKNIDIEEFLNYVKYGEFKELQFEIAGILDKKQRTKRKSEILPYVTISGVFNPRSNAGLVAHSGLIAVDFDDVDDFDKAKKELSNDLLSYAVFKSVSGLGLCVLVKVSNEEIKHQSHFRWLERYYYDTYGYVIDASCKDVGRPRFVSYDRDIFINEKSKKAGVLNPKKTKPKSIDFIPTESQMDRIVNDIRIGGVNITESYEDYLKVGMAIASEYGEGGRNYFHIVASQSSKYNQKDADRKYNNLLKGGVGVKIGTFFYLANQEGIEIHTREEKQAFAAAKAAKRSHATVAGAVKTATTIHNVPEKLAKEAAEAVFKSNDNSLYQSDDDTPVIEQISNHLSLQYTFFKNEITRVIEDNKGRELDEQYENTIYVRAKAIIGNKVMKRDIECLINSDNTEMFNPLKDFYEANCTLPHKPEIIEQFIDAVKSDTPNYKYWVRKWLLGIPAAINGEVVRTVLVLCGGQYSGKTSWFRMLLPKELKNYYAESNLDRGKDDEIGMTQNLIVMDDEFGGKSRKDAEKFKELVSKETFFLREPYGRKNVHLKRLSLIAGTSNDSAVINDPTGNSRIIPINMLSIDFKVNEAIDRAQLFVELWRAWEGGEKWNMTKEDLKELAIFGEYHEEVSIEGEMLDKYFEAGNELFGAAEIKDYIESVTQQKFFGTNKLGKELKKRYVQFKSNGKRGYRLSKIDINRAKSAPDECPY